MIYFTADLHLGHSSIIKHCSRPFLSVAEMDAAIVEAINETVLAKDTLWVLGDFAFRGRDPSHYREQIKCRNVHLILGNHDRRTKCMKAGFSSVSDVAEISVGKQRIWLSHYAHRSWPASHRGAWHLYGHSHGKLDADDKSREIDALDVGVDNFQQDGPPVWQPWSMDDLARVLPRTNRTPSLVSTPVECSVPIEWTKRPYMVDPPSGWRYGFPRRYDPASDGDMRAWMIAHGYPESLARLGLPCTFTEVSDER
jgi:calcineurin-like phosphoesterase family protein